MPQALHLTYNLTGVTPLVVSAAAGLLEGSGDPDSEPFVAALAGDPTFGTVTVNAEGSFVYIPGPGYSGSDIFTYLVSDGFGGTSVETVTLTSE